MTSASEARSQGDEEATMLGRVTLEIAMATDPGRLRAERPNQDAIGEMAGMTPPPEDAQARGRLFVLADGMGGAAGGREASRMAVDLLLESYYEMARDDPTDALLGAIHHVNEQIHARGRREPDLAGLGTTVVAALVLGDRLMLAHVGDSRAYLLRHDSLQRLTNDHSWVGEQIRYGLLTPEEAQHHPHRNILTRNLGSDPQTRPDVTSLLLQQDDRILLCSDGLWGVLDEETLGETLAGRPVDEAVEMLVAQANEAGGPDNISAILLHVTDHRPRPQTSDTAEAITEPMPVIQSGDLPSLSPPAGRRLLLVAVVLLLAALALLAGWQRLRPRPAPPASQAPLSVSTLGVSRNDHWETTGGVEWHAPAIRAGRGAATIGRQPSGIPPVQCGRASPAGRNHPEIRRTA